MSVNLTVTPQIEADPNVVQDEKGNSSNLYLATENTTIATNQAAPSSSLTVFGEPGTRAIATVRPDDERRDHVAGYIGSERVFALQTLNKRFDIRVGNGTRISIEPKGGMLTLVGPVAIEGISRIPASEALDLALNRTTGQIGYK